jgi:hypothetical protein
MASSWRGEEIKGSYRLTGKASIRVVTARETYDYPLNLERFHLD